MSKKISGFTYYLSGLLTAFSISLIIAVGIVFQIGIETLLQTLRGPSYEVANLQPDVLQEIRNAGGDIENTVGLTPQRPHDTILVKPDSEVGYRLRPNVDLDVSVLQASGEFNLDPPLLHLPSNSVFSQKTRDYIRNNSRLNIRYRTDSNGLRVTLPAVTSEQRVLIVGDSVAFGVGVDDSQTSSSQLQNILGPHVQVINAGVGGYEADQIFSTAERLSREQKFSTLVYIACQNDFDDPSFGRKVLTKYQTIADRFEAPIVVILETYLEYNVRDSLLNRGWPDSKIEATNKLRTELAELAKKFGYAYADWTTVVDGYRQSSQSVFAPYGLYVDHCHLSPLGNGLMARQIASLIKPQESFP